MKQRYKWLIAGISTVAILTTVAGCEAKSSLGNDVAKASISRIEISKQKQNLDSHISTVTTSVSSENNTSKSGGKIYSVTMVNSMDGWASGSVTQHAALWKTTDGGNHWISVTLPFEAKITTTYRLQTQIRFDPINSTTIWAAFVSKNGDQIFVTTDGGQNWIHRTTVKTNDDMIALLQFIDSSHGWLVTNNGSGMQFATNNLHDTVNRAISWKLISSSGKGAFSIPGLVGGNIELQNKTTGWMAGQSPINGEALLWVTRDQGATWKRKLLAYSPMYKNATITVGIPTFDNHGNSEIGVMPVTFYIYRSDQTSTLIYTTEDKGKVWKPGHALITHVPVITDFVNARYGWATNAPWDPKRPELLKTSDAGRKWSVISRSHELINTTQLEFVSPQVGFAVTMNPMTGQIGLDKTTNGGSSWIHYSMVIE